MFYLHPSIVIMIAWALLILYRKKQTAFTLIAITYPVTSAVSLIFTNGSKLYSFFGLNLIFDFNNENKLIAFAMLLAMLAINLYACSKDRKSDVIIATIYCASTVTCLLAGDMLSMFIALECSSLAACALIYTGGNRSSMSAARQYLLTHLFSGSLILLGIIEAVTITKGNISIIPFASIATEGYSSVIYILACIGCLINVASIPFHLWLINGYPNSSNAGFIYLITFTTKVSMLILLKFFSGFQYLEFAGILMIVFSGIKACFEDNIRRLICYLSLTQMGFMIVGISLSEPETDLGVILYIFIHILYNTLFCLVFQVIADKSKVTLISEIKQINSRLVLASFWISVIAMANLPLTPGFTAKLLVTNNLSLQITYFATLLLNILIFIALPVREFAYARNNKWSNLDNLNSLSRASLALMSITTSVALLFGYLILSKVIPGYPCIAECQDSLLPSSLKLLFVLAVGILLSWFLKITRSTKEPKNFSPLGPLGDRFYKRYSKYFKAETERPSYLGLDVVEKQAFTKIDFLHNQQTGILIVFTLLIILILIFNS